MSKYCYRVPSVPLALLVAFLCYGINSVQAGDSVYLNEIKIDNPGADTEFVEIKGFPGTTLDNIFYIVIGDGTGGSGVAERIVDLSGNVIDANGFYVADGFSIENSDNLTHLLVVGQLDALGASLMVSEQTDLDLDDDGVLDLVVDTDGDAVVDALAWVAVLDSVSTVETFDIPASGEYIYSTTTIGPDGTFPPGAIRRCGQGWLISDFGGADDTPGAENFCPAEDCADTLDNDGDNLVDCDDPDCFGNAACVTPALSANRLGLEVLGSYTTGIFDESAAEIVAYDAASGKVFVTNSDSGSVDVLQLDVAGNLTKINTLAAAGAPTHVRVWDDAGTSRIVASVPSAVATDPGKLQVFDMPGSAYSGTPILSEIRIDQAGADNDEYVEIAAAPGTDLTGLTYVVIGDFPSGTIETAISLDGQVVPADGTFLIAETSFTLGTADLTVPSNDLNHENSQNSTYFLVTGFANAAGDNVDTAGDGVLEWGATVVDSVALVEDPLDANGQTTAGNLIYSTTVVGPDGTFVPGHVSRCGSDGSVAGDWIVSDFDIAEGTDTPGSANVCAIATYATGALPDMVFVSGNYALTADEGEPSGAVDPDGSVTIVDLMAGTTSTVTFDSLNGTEDALRAQGIRIFPGNSASQDLEPEYIAVSPDGNTGYAVCQEANAVVVFDIATASFTEIVAFGRKDHSLPGNELDPSDRDSGINIGNWPVLGMHMPDSAVAYGANGNTYLVTANEGDARSEDERIEDFVLDPTVFPNAADLQQRSQLGRLGASTIDGDIDSDGDFDELHVYGARSFSIWDMTNGGVLVYDSGSELERVVAGYDPFDFNSNNDENDSFESRSDNKGIEPEAVTVGEINGRTIAFVGAERQGGIYLYDVTDPANSYLLSYINNRDFSGNAEAGTAGDLGPEGIVFVPADQNPTGSAIILVANEVSGSTTAYRIVELPDQDLRTESKEAESTKLTDISVYLDSYGADVDAYSYGACQDSTQLSLVSVTTGSGVGTPEFENYEVVAGGYTVGVVMSLGSSGLTIAPGFGIETTVATYDVLGAAGSTTSIDICNTLGSPAVEALAVAGGVTAATGVISGEVRIIAPIPDFQFAIADATGEYGTDGNGTVATSVSITQTSSVAPIATSGFSMGVRNEVAAMAAKAVTEPVPGAAQFFTSSILGGGWTLGVVYDFNGVTTLSYEAETTVANVEYSLTGGLAGSTDTVTTDLAFADDLGSPAVENLVTFPDGSTQAPVLVGAAVTLSPAPAPFTYTIGNANAEFDSLGAGSFATNVALAQTAASAISVSGFSLAVAHDPVELQALGADAHPDLGSLNGGTGPSFFEATIGANGMAIGCIFDFDNAEPVDYSSAAGVVVLNYSLTGAQAGGPGGSTTLAVVNGFGSPATDSLVTDTLGVTYPAEGVDGVVTLTPPPPPFTLTVADAAGVYDATGSGSVSAALSIDQTGTIAASGFSAAVAHNSVQLQADSVVAGSGLSGLNSGAGPDFFEANLLSGGVTVGCIFSFGNGAGSDQITFAGEEVAVVNYALTGFNAGSSATVTTDLTVTDGLGNPAVDNLVTDAAGVTYAMAGVEGTVTLSPAPSPFEFVVANGSGEYNGTNGQGSGSTTVAISQNSGSAIPLSGFQMSLEWDASVLSVATISQGAGLSALDAGAGAEFFQASIAGATATVGCVFDFDGAELLGFTSAADVVDLAFDVNVAAGSTSVISADVSIDSEGSVENLVSDAAGNTFDAAGFNGSVTVSPAAPIFTFAVPASTIVETGGTDVAVSIEDLSGSTAVAGFSMGISYDTAEYDFASATPAGALAAVRAGAGPEFFESNALADGVTIGCVTDFSGVDTVNYATSETAVNLNLALSATATGGVTAIDFTNNLGAPSVPNVVSGSDGTTYVASGVGGELAGSTAVAFRRSDCNGDGLIDIADGIFSLNFLFQSGSAGECFGACDTNADSVIDVADAIYTFSYQFSSGPMPSAPFPDCGVSPSGEECNSYDGGC